MPIAAQRGIVRADRVPRTRFARDELDARRKARVQCGMGDAHFGSRHDRSRASEMRPRRHAPCSAPTKVGYPSNSIPASLIELRVCGAATTAFYFAGERRVDRSFAESSAASPCGAAIAPMCSSSGSNCLRSRRISAPSLQFGVDRNALRAQRGRCRRKRRRAPRGLRGRRPAAARQILFTCGLSAALSVISGPIPAGSAGGDGDPQARLI